MVGGMIRIPSQDASAEEFAAFQQKLIDKNVGLIHKPDSDDAEGMQNFYRALGAPESVDGYTIPEGFPQDRAKQFAELALQAGISNKQFEAVMSGILGADNEVSQQMTVERENALNALKHEWGTAYDSKLERAARVAKSTEAPEGLVEAIGKGEVDAKTLRWLDKLAAAIGGESAEIRDQIGGTNGQTRDELAAQRDELTRKLIKETLPPTEHQRLVQKLVGLNERLAS